MAQVIARCRLTGHYAFMAMNVSGDEIDKWPEIFVRRFCPFCACEHDWYKRDVKLVERSPARRGDTPQAASR